MSSINLNFYANSLHFRTEVRVVLPEYADQRNPKVPHKKAFDASHRFPVVYLLHGFTGDYSDWCGMLSIERYASASGFAIVMPHGYNTWYLNVPNGLQMETMISDELPAAMEAMLPISADPTDRFIAGLSMGGTGAMRIAWKYPERYRAAAAISALTDSSLPLCEPAENAAYEAILRQSIELCHGGKAGLEDRRKNIYKLALDGMSTGGKLPPLLFQYGEQDPRFEMQYKAFKAFAVENRLPVTFSAAPGAHNFEYWDPAIREALEWLRCIHKEQE